MDKEKLSFSRKGLLRTLPKTASRSRVVFAGIILVITILITIIIWRTVKEEALRKVEGQFYYRTEETIVAIQKRMLAYEQVLKGGLGLFAASDSVSRAEWRTYVENLKIEENYPGILGIGYSIYVPANQLQNHIKQIRSEGFPDYRIWPEGERDEYTSIIFLEPFSGRNLRAFGYDMISESTRRAAMHKARDLSKTIVSKKVTLVQETEEDVQAGFLMYLPLYKKGYPLETTEQRRAALQGFVYSPFRMNDLMEGILGQREFPDIHLEIFDEKGSDYNYKMYESDSDNIDHKDFPNPLFERVTEIIINDHKWSVRFLSLPYLEQQIDSEKAWLFLITGLLLSLLLFLAGWIYIATKYLNKELSLILGSTAEGIFGLDLKGRCIFINRSAADMLNIEPADCLNKNMHGIVHNVNDNIHQETGKKCSVDENFRKQDKVRVEDETFWKSNKSPFPVEYASYPIIDKGVIKGTVITFTDITQRKKVLEQITTSLEEKVILLKEVHHRVKNNLQIISSLLSLQTLYIKNEQDKEIFQESQDRIRSMALIHEKLYQSNNMSKLNFSAYVQELIMNLFNSYKRSSSKIKINIEIEDVLLSIDTAITLGLALNELISNSLKHAFSENGQGEIFVCLKSKENNTFNIIVGDNGKGFPENVNFRETESLGLQLVNTLVEQLDGTIELDSSSGTKFSITFRANEGEEFPKQ